MPTSETDAAKSFAQGGAAPTGSSSMNGMGAEMTGGGSSKMPSLRLRTFSGLRDIGVYREWKVELLTTQFVYKSTDAQMALLVFLSWNQGHSDRVLFSMTTN
jgi:hypothetical protein